MRSSWIFRVVNKKLQYAVLLLVHFLLGDKAQGSAVDIVAQAAGIQPVILPAEALSGRIFSWRYL